MRTRLTPLFAIAMVVGCSPAAVAPAAPTATADPAPATASVTDAAPTTAPTSTASPAVLTADVLTYRGDMSRSGRMPGPGPTGDVGVAWQFEAGAPIGSQAVVGDGIVYVITTRGTLYALDLANGSVRWQADVGASTHSTPSLVGDLILVAAEDGLHAMRIGDGSPLWTTTATGPVNGTPAVVGEIAICRSSAGVAYGVDVESGEVSWSIDVNVAGDTSIAADDGVAIVGLANGVVVALDAMSGAERWRSDTGDGGRIGTPTIDDGRVFVATLDGPNSTGHHLLALDLATGERLWTVASPGDRVAYSPAVADGLAVFGSEDSRLIALDAADGALVWQTAAPGVVEIVTTIAGDVVYSASNGGEAFALDRATGDLLWQVDIQGIPYGVVVTAGRVLVGTSTGLLYAIGQANP